MLTVITGITDGIVTEEMIDNLYHEDFVMIVDNELTIVTDNSEKYMFMLELFNVTNIQTRQIKEP